MTSFEHGLEPLLELAAVLRARDQRAHVEREDVLVLQPLGHVAAHDALRQSLDDRRLADARLADQHRVVLGLAREDADDAPDLLVAADHRIELAVARQLDQVAAVLLERLVGRLGIGARHALVAAHLLKRLQEPVVRDAELCEHLAEPLVAGSASKREHQVLDRDVLVLERFVASWARTSTCSSRPVT